MIQRDRYARSHWPTIAMKTAFTSTQLAQPRTARANAVIRSCVRHGFCPQTCPTYVLNGDENDSPRGRIELMRAMPEQGGSPDAKTVLHIDRCLSCLGCETTCAARARYRDLADRARAHIEQHFRRPWTERLVRSLLAQVLPRPKRLRLALMLARVTRPLHHLLPQRLRAIANFAPSSAPTESSFSGRHFAAIGTRKRRVALLPGCVQQVIGAATNDAAIRLLTRQGCDVIISAATGCCGALPLHMGRADDARAKARKLISAWSAELAGDGLDAIVNDGVGLWHCGQGLWGLVCRRPAMVRSRH